MDLDDNPSEDGNLKKKFIKVLEEKDFVVNSLRSMNEELLVNSVGSPAHTFFQSKSAVGLSFIKIIESLVSEQLFVSVTVN